MRWLVDGMNVIGTRPDGWWRDRAGATARLRDRLVRWARSGLSAHSLPGGVDLGPLTYLLPRVVLVVEGRAARIAPSSAYSEQPSGSEWPAGSVTTHAAGRAGDDDIVAVAAASATEGDQTVVVTSDRGLRARLHPSAVPVGAGWLLTRLDELTT